MSYGEDLISVIVPIYNAQNWLDKAVESLVNQTYENIEIILVDDGSTDDSLKKCYDWADRDDRVLVIHQDNAGVSAARNAGVHASKGQYIGFIDADDMALNEMYERLMKAEKSSGADIVVCNVNKIFEKDGSQKSHTKYTEEKILESREALMELFTSSVGPWNKLYKRELFEKVSFQEGVTMGEDGRWFMDTLTNSPCKVHFITDMLYLWTKAEGSSSNTEFKPSYLDAVDTGRYYCEKMERYDAALISPIFTKRLCNIYLRTFTRMAWLPWSKIREYKKYLIRTRNLCREDKNRWLRKEDLQDKINYRKIRLVTFSVYAFVCYKKLEKVFKR